MTLHRQTTSQASPLEVELMDLSRNGAQIYCEEPFDIGEPISLQLVIESSNLDVHFAGQVRWQQIEDDAYAIGCQFDDEIDWETLGELFLCGVLSTDLPPDQLPLP